MQNEQIFGSPQDIVIKENNSIELTGRQSTKDQFVNNQKSKIETLIQSDNQKQTSQIISQQSISQKKVSGIYQNVNFEFGDNFSPAQIQQNMNQLPISTKIALKNTQLKQKNTSNQVNQNSNGSYQKVKNDGSENQNMNQEFIQKHFNDDSMAKLLASKNLQKQIGIQKPAGNQTLTAQHQLKINKNQEKNNSILQSDQDNLIMGQQEQKNLVNSRKMYYQQQKSSNSIENQDNIQNQGIFNHDQDQMKYEQIDQQFLQNQNQLDSSYKSQNTYQNKNVFRPNLQLAINDGFYYRNYAGQENNSTPIDLDFLETGAKKEGNNSQNYRIQSLNNTNPSAIQQYYQQLNQTNSYQKRYSQNLKENSLFNFNQSQSGIIQQPKKIMKTNVLTGAASTSYQLPIIWAGQYMGLVSYQVQKENEENEKRLKQLQEMTKQANLKKNEKKKTQISLPMRGRKLYINDVKNEQILRCEILKQANENEELKIEQNNRNFYQQVRNLEEEYLKQRFVQQEFIERLAQQVQNQRKSQKDLNVLKTKAFSFQKDFRQSSANESYKDQQLKDFSSDNPNIEQNLIKKSNQYYLDEKFKTFQYNDMIEKQIIQDFQSQNSGIQDMNINQINKNEKIDIVPKVVNINEQTSFPLIMNKKKNKNDFYRFLLQQNMSNLNEFENISNAPKINNDILIPRSILKKNEFGQKDRQRMRDEFEEFEELLGQGDENQISSTEGIVGKHLDTNGPVLSPKNFNRNYLENQYRIIEMREQAILLKHEAHEQQQKIQYANQINESPKENIEQVQKILLEKDKIQIKDSINKDLDILDNSNNLIDQLENKKLEIEKNYDSILQKEQESIQQPDFKVKKTKVRRAQGDGFFKTGVEVIEDEEIDYEGTIKNAAELLKSGQLNAEQIKELLEKKLKDDRIFGYHNFEEFNQKYFKKELVAFEEFHKIRQLKYARVKYNNRISSNTRDYNHGLAQNRQQYMNKVNDNYLQLAGSQIGAKNNLDLQLTSGVGIPNVQNYSY